MFNNFIEKFNNITNEHTYNMLKDGPLGLWTLLFGQPEFPKDILTQAIDAVLLFGVIYLIIRFICLQLRKINIIRKLITYKVGAIGVILSYVILVMIIFISRDMNLFVTYCGCSLAIYSFIFTEFSIYPYKEKIILNTNKKLFFIIFYLI